MTIRAEGVKLAVDEGWIRSIVRNELVEPTKDIAYAEVGLKPSSPSIGLDEDNIRTIVRGEIAKHQHRT